METAIILTTVVIILIALRLFRANNTLDRLLDTADSTTDTTETQKNLVNN